MPPGLAVPPRWVSGCPGAGGGWGAPGSSARELPQGARAFACLRVCVSAGVYLHTCMFMHVHTRVRACAPAPGRRHRARLQHPPARPGGPSAAHARGDPACGGGSGERASELSGARRRRRRWGSGRREGGGTREGGGSGTSWSSLTGAREAGKGRRPRSAAGRLVESGPRGAERRGPGAAAAPRPAPGRAAPCRRAPAARPARTMLLPQLCWLPLLAGLLPPAPAQKFSALTVSPGPVPRPRPPQRPGRAQVALDEVAPPPAGAAGAGGSRAGTRCARRGQTAAFFGGLLGSPPPGAPTRLEDLLRCGRLLGSYRRG